MERWALCGRNGGVSRSLHVRGFREGYGVFNERKAVAPASGDRENYLGMRCDLFGCMVMDS